MARQLERRTAWLSNHQTSKRRDAGRLIPAFGATTGYKTISTRLITILIWDAIGECPPRPTLIYSHVYSRLFHPDMSAAFTFIGLAGRNLSIRINILLLNQFTTVSEVCKVLFHLSSPHCWFPWRAAHYRLCRCLFPDRTRRIRSHLVRRSIFIRT